MWWVCVCVSCRSVEPLAVAVCLCVCVCLQGAEDKGFVSKVDMVIKALRLERCADTIVGNGLIRGVSGGEKRRLTIGEMLVRGVRV